MLRVHAASTKIVVRGELAKKKAMRREKKTIQKRSQSVVSEPTQITLEDGNMSDEKKIRFSKGCVCMHRSHVCICICCELAKKKALRRDPEKEPACCLRAEAVNADNMREEKITFSKGCVCMHRAHFLHT